MYLRNLCSSLALLLASGVFAFAELNVQAVSAERSIPFGVAAGQLVQSGSTLFFVDQDDAARTFAIDRENIESVRDVDGLLTIQTREAVAGRTTHTFRLGENGTLDVQSWARSGPGLERAPVVAATSAASARTASGDDSGFVLEYDVEDERSFRGNEMGKLRLTDREVRYTSITNSDRSFVWEYKDVKELVRKNPNKVKLKAFNGSEYTFTLVGESMGSGEYRQIAGRLARARRGE